MTTKILMVLEGSFPPDDRVYKEAQLLINQGFQVTIACTSVKDEPVFEIFNDITIYRKHLPKLIYKSSVAALKFPVYFKWWKNFLQEIFNKDSFDIIHIHDLPLSKVGVHFQKKYRLRLVIDLHENWPAYLTKATHTQSFLGKCLSNEKQWRNYERWAAIKADTVITVVDEMKNRIVQLNVPDSKIAVLQNTILPEEYPIQKNSASEGPFTLIFAGGINIERGLQYIIPALRNIKTHIPDIKLQIIGKGSYLPTLKQIATVNEVSHFVEYIGWKPLPELMELTAKADIALIPHIKWEQTDCSSPNKLFQYMHAGVPLLVSNCDSVARIVNETQSGESYVFDQIDDFTNKVLKLYQNPDYRKQLSENGKKWILEKYNWNDSSMEFVEMYKKLK